MRRHFTAPWARSLKVISLVFSILLLAIAWFIPWPDDLGPWIQASPVVVLVGCALYTVRGYELDGGTLHVQRLLWHTHIPLRKLTGAEWRKGGFGVAIRTFGNGGLYSFSGWYYHKSIGSFRALATRTHDAVILQFSDRKPIVVTPGDAAAFVAELNKHVAAQHDGDGGSLGGLVQ